MKIIIILEILRPHSGGKVHGWKLIVICGQFEIGTSGITLEILQQLHEGSTAAGGLLRLVK